jgi:hypothetical protein
MKLMFKNPRLLFGMVVTLGVFAMSARTVSDPDIWWHLRTGQAIVETHHLFYSDPFSFTRLGQPWVNHEWLTDILVFTVYKAGGMLALTATFSALTAAGFFLVFVSCRARPAAAALFTVWGALVAAPTWGVRPQTISFLFAALLWLILRRTEQRRRLIWWTVPLMFLWVNLHAGFAIGIALLILHAASIGLDWSFGLERSHARLRLRNTALALVACVAVVSINPYGLRMYSYPFQTLSSGGMQQWIAEWASPDFHEGKFAPLLLSILFSLVLVAGSREVRPREVLVFGAGMLAALSAIRHAPIFVVLATPLLSEWNDRLLSARSNAGRVKPAKTGHGFKLAWGGVIIAVLATFAFARIVQVSRQQAQSESQQFPEGAATFLLRHPELQPTFNAYNWGGYLIWRLYPAQRVFIDGRADVYGKELMRQFTDSYSLTKDWRGPFEHWSIQSVVLPRSAPLGQALRSLPEWKNAYADGQAEVLVRTFPPPESEVLTGEAGKRSP